MQLTYFTFKIELILLIWNWSVSRQGEMRLLLFAIFTHLRADRFFNDVQREACWLPVTHWPVVCLDGSQVRFFKSFVADTLSR